MLVHAVCPHCAKNSTVPAVYAGKKVPCPGCREPFVVQAAEAGFEPPVPAPETADGPAADSPFGSAAGRVNWQGYPYFEASCLDGRPERGRYRAFFTPDRLVFLPVLDRPTSRPVDPIKYGLVGLLIGLAFLFVPIPRGIPHRGGPGVWVIDLVRWSLPFLGAGIGYYIGHLNRSIRAHKSRNEDERFREWKVEDLAAVDPGAFVILPGKTAEVSFRATKAGWVVLGIRRDNGHEWVIRPEAVDDVRVCLENLRLFDPHVTNTVGWNPDTEMYVVCELD